MVIGVAEEGVLEVISTTLASARETRRAQALPSPFKSGLFHLATRFPETELVPVYLDNLYRSMPKGTFLPVPLTCSVRFGKPLERRVDEAKGDFLERAREAIVELA